jgi:hypothetical protein
VDQARVLNWTLTFFRETVAPAWLLWFYAIAYGVASALGPEDSPSMPKRAGLAAAVALPLVISLWVLADARKRDRCLCYDYGSFVYFAWFVIVPVYLFQTRGPKAFLTLLCCAGIWLAAMLAAVVVLVIRTSLGSI